MKKLDLAKVEQRLFDDARNSITRDYGLTNKFETAPQLLQAVLSTFGFTNSAHPHKQKFENSEVYRAAVWAFGTVGQHRYVFLRNENSIRKKLLDYDPTVVALASGTSRLRARQLTAFFPEKTTTLSVLAWAKQLALIENYYGQNIAATAQMMLDRELALSDKELGLAVVALLASPSARHARLKLPGMGYSLGTEFLRNLGWNIFKPDRQIERLFGYWEMEGAADVETSAQKIQKVVQADGPIAEGHEQQLARYLRISLIGAGVAPEGMPCSYLDTALSMLGRYVETRGTESELNYFF